MNEFNYRVYHEVYNYIICGEKTIEFRLLNDKSSKIKVGDIIIFTVVDNETLKIKVEVTQLYHFKNVEDLWKNKQYLVNKDISKEELEKEFYKIFGEEKVKGTSIIGIGFKLI